MAQDLVFWANWMRWNGRVLRSCFVFPGMVRSVSKRRFALVTRGQNTLQNSDRRFEIDAPTRLRHRADDPAKLRGS